MLSLVGGCLLWVVDEGVVDVVLQRLLCHPFIHLGAHYVAPH